MVNKENIESIYPLSPMQLGMLFHSISDQKSNVYDVVMHFHLQGELNVGAFKRAWQQVADRQPVLRTFFLWENRENPLQIVRNQVELPVREYNWSHLSTAEQQEQVEIFLQQDREKGFNLANASLVRLSLIQVDQNSYHFIFTFHHILVDGWSVALLLKEVFAFYQANLRGESIKLDPPPAYKEYISWIKEQDLSQAEIYWRKILQGFTEITPIPSDTTPEYDPNLENRYSEHHVRLAKKTTTSLLSFTQEYQITLNTLVQGVWALLLSRYNSETDVVFGSVVSGRSIPLPDSESMVGLFINTLPVRTQISPETSLVPWLRGFQEHQVQARQFEYSSLRNIQAWSEMYRSRESSLFDSIMVFGGNSLMDDLLKKVSEDFEIRNLGVLEGSHYPLSILVDPGEELVFRIVYDQQRFDQETMTRIGKHLETMLEAIVADPDRPLSAYSLLTSEEKQRLVVEFNQTANKFPKGKTVVHLFEQQVEETPNSAALRYGDQTISYAELNRRSNQLANYLANYGLGRGQVVALCLERSPEVIIAILGTLKAGAAYLPLDASLPAKRLALMLEETEAPMVLTSQTLGEKLPATNAKVVHLDTGWSAILSEPSNNDSLPMPTPDDLAYIIYTSGSTGIPKGTMVRHNNLFNYIYWARGFYLQGDRYDFPLFSSLSFDLTVTSIFTPLVSGGSIVIYRETDSDSLVVLDVFKDNLVDIIKLTPAHLALLQAADLKPDRVRKMIVGGEDFKRGLAKSINDLFEGEIDIYNEYGPTEATVGCMIHRFDPEEDMEPSVPIGKPIDNAQIFVLDEHLKPVPPGVIGEMCIGGAGVALGYLNRPELTSSKFVNNPFEMDSDMYRTGDLARWTPAGQMQFLGRSDHQVKIKGYRVELGEIEGNLQSHPDIETAVVTVFQPEIAHADNITKKCVECGLPENYPAANFNSAGVCQTCRDFSELEDRFSFYFKTPADLQEILDRAKQENHGQYDCLVLYSGGKDSSYMLYQLVREYGMHPLVFSMDNGYISEEAKENIRRVTDDLEVDLVFGQTPHMNAVFVDSLERHSNVCDGCFKVIYTLSINLARQKGIKYIFTGLTRGQLFETRLSDMFKAQIYDAEEIDRTVLDARKAYHRFDDAVNKLLDVKIFADDAVFDQVQLVDFYRYTDISLTEMYRYLDENAPWVRPSDTGRSTNCLINDAGIYIHKKERGYHNYALPYSWDVRIGHKTRAETVDELNDDIDEANVRRILAEVGFDEKMGKRPEKRLVAYYVSHQSLSSNELRKHLSERLPDYMMPSAFIQLGEMPLTVNGKIDRSALPVPDSSRSELETGYVAPTTENETKLVEIWSQIFQLPEVGIHDNFFDLGGDSIISIQIVAKAKQSGLHFTPRDVFEQQTIVQLAQIADSEQITKSEQGLVTGSVPLTPIQHWFFNQEFSHPHHWNQTLWLDVPANVNREALQEAFKRLSEQHDALRSHFDKSVEGAWEQNIPPENVPLSLDFHDLIGMPGSDQEHTLKDKVNVLESTLNLENGPLLKAALFALGSSEPLRLVVTCHHLVIDGVSWQPLLSDWETAYHQINDGQAVQFPPKTTSFREWAEKMNTYAQSPALNDELEYWRSDSVSPPFPPEAENGGGKDSVNTISQVLSVASTTLLLNGVHAAYNTNVVDLLLTAWANAYNDFAGSDTASVMMEGHGRESEIVNDVDLSRTIGWFTAHYPVHITLIGSFDPGAQIKKVKELLRNIPNNGIGYGLLRYLSTESSLVSQPEPAVLFNYLGQFDRALPASDLFTLAQPLRGSYSPYDPRTHALEVNAYIRNSQLHLDVVYNTSQFNTEAVQTLTDNFSNHLDTLIQHCLSSDVGGHTPSDFALVDLSEEQFDRLSDMLNKLDGS